MRIRRRRRKATVAHRRAQRRSAPRPRIRRRRRTGGRRRRTNPAPLTSVVLANPHGVRRRKTRRRRRKVVALRVRRKGGARRSRRRRTFRVGRGMHIVRRRRRTNPIMSLGSTMGLVRLGIFGGVGIVVARIAGGLYTKYLSSYVLGTAPPTWRQHLNEFLRLLAMSLATYGVSKALSKARFLRPADTQALLVGGLAESARQGIGVVYKAISPTGDASRYGLNGMGEAYPPWADAQGNVYAFNASSGAYELAGVVDEEYFAGMHGVVGEEYFEGAAA